jgi:hypothetical protein
MRPWDLAVDVIGVDVVAVIDEKLAVRLELDPGGLEGEYVGVAVLAVVVAIRGRGKQLLGILPHEFGPVVAVELFEFIVQQRPGLCAPVKGRTQRM